MKTRCWACRRRLKDEIKVEIINEVHSRYLECTSCQGKTLIDFFCPDLQDLVDQVNARVGMLISNGQDIEKDNEVINLTKRINNLSKFIMTEAERRSNGQPCYVETTIIGEGECVDERNV